MRDYSGTKTTNAECSWRLEKRAGERKKLMRKRRKKEEEEEEMAKHAEAQKLCCGFGQDYMHSAI